MGRTSVCEKTGLRKGAWSKEEDRVLKTYINNNGHGNWNELPKLAGLLRCGKSCRLRWKNYLDPIVKRGDFTKEEVDFIIEMHKLGHRWSKIASHLPRRTDNEIKKFYYTNLKKKDKDNDTSDRERPKPAGKKFTIGEIQSNSIPILESYSMQPIPLQISGRSSSQPISSQTSSHSSSSIDRSVNENHILKEPERDTIINLSDSECPHIEEEPERETLLQMYERLWEEGLSKDPHIPIPPLHSGSNLSMDKSKNKNRILKETENGSLKQTYERVWEEGLSKDPTYPWDCVYGYGIRGSSSPQRSLCRLISSRTFRRVSSSIDKSKNENRILEETENGSLKQIYERVWEEGLSEDLHIPDPVFEEQTYPWSSVYVCRREIDYSSFTDESENESSIPEETERGSLKQVYECVRLQPCGLDLFLASIRSSDQLQLGCQWHHNIGYWTGALGIG